MQIDRVLMHGYTIQAKRSYGKITPAIAYKQYDVMFAKALGGWQGSCYNNGMLERDWRNA